METVDLMLETKSPVNIFRGVEKGHIDITSGKYGESLVIGIDEVRTSEVLDQIELDDVIEFFGEEKLLRELPIEHVAKYLSDTGCYNVEEIC